MYKCSHCGTVINASETPTKCPACPNSDPEKFSVLTEIKPNPDSPLTTPPFPINPPYVSTLERICNKCEELVIVDDTTGTCPACGRDAVFTEPEHDAPGLIPVDRYAGRTVKVDPDNVLVDDPENGFTDADATEPNAAAD